MITKKRSQNHDHDADYDDDEEDDVVLDLVVRAGEEAAGGVACVGADHLSSRHHDHQHDHSLDHQHDHRGERE